MSSPYCRTWIFGIWLELGLGLDRRQMASGDLSQRRGAIERLRIELDAVPRRVGIQHRNRAEQRPRIRVRRVARRSRASRPSPRSFPDTSRRRGVQMCSTSRRSWAMNRYVSFSRCCRSSSSFTTCAWIDTSSAETGFVGNDERRVERDRARDADALTLAAAEFVRIACQVRRAPGRPARTALRPVVVARLRCRACESAAAPRRCRRRACAG